MDERNRIIDDIVDEEDEMLLEMATIGYASCSPKDPEYIVTVDKADTRRGDPYFKFYNGDDVHRGVEVARISYERAEYVETHSSGGHPLFRLSHKQKKALVKFFNEPFDNDPTITNWQYAIIQHNNEKCRKGAVSGRSLHIDFRKLTRAVKDADPELKFALPIDLPMPNYMALR